MKRYLAAFLALVLLLTSVAVIASAAEGKGLQRDEETGKYYYVKPDGTRVKGWYHSEKGENGEDSYWDDQWYYGEDDGYLTEGWKQIGGDWYYFWPEMDTTSWYDQEKDLVYLFSESGAWTGISTNQTGWVQFGNKWYYVYSETYGDNNEYKWAYFYSNGNYPIGDKVYIFKNCVMQDNGWVDLKGINRTNWYYANSNGEAATGWKKIDGTWYYFGKWGRMYQDTMYWDWTEDGTKLNGVYAFDKSGAMIVSQWHKETWTDEEGNNYTDWLYMGADGAAKTGWFQVGGKWYYSGESGWLWMDAWVDDAAGNWYYLDESGAMVTGWYKNEDGEWLYFKTDGAQVKSDWVMDGDSWYYMDENGNMVKNCTLTIDGIEYKFAANGEWMP